eukprot:4349385-Amphidinium_carterae.1
MSKEANGRFLSRVAHVGSIHRCRTACVCARIQARITILQDPLCASEAQGRLWRHSRGDPKTLSTSRSQSAAGILNTALLQNHAGQPRASSVHVRSLQQHLQAWSTLAAVTSTPRCKRCQQSCASLCMLGLGT